MTENKTNKSIVKNIDSIKCSCINGRVYGTSNSPCSHCNGSGFLGYVITEEQCARILLALRDAFVVSQQELYGPEADRILEAIKIFMSKYDYFNTDWAIKCLALVKVDGENER